MSTEIAVADKAPALAVPTNSAIDVYLPTATEVPPLKLDSPWPLVTAAGLCGLFAEGAAFVSATQIGAEHSSGALLAALVLGVFGLCCWFFALQIAQKRGVL